MICGICERPTSGISTSPGVVSAVCPKCAAEQAGSVEDWPKYEAVDPAENVEPGKKTLTRKPKGSTT